MKKRILVIGTYPIVNPQHGGQKRLAAIVDNYKENFSQVKYCAIYFKGFYKEKGRNDIAVSKQTEKRVVETPFLGDVVVGEAIYNDQKVRNKIFNLIKSFRPKIIHIEQPFPYLGLKRLIDEHNIDCKIVFGSQNIEAPMKEEILINAGYSQEDIQGAISKISELEKELSRVSDLTIACTELDLSKHKSMGAKNLVLAPNGIKHLSVSSDAVREWRSTLDEKGIEKIVLFVGSAHPPNWVGFYDMVGKSLGFIPQNTRIVIAGSICDFFEKDIVPKKTLDIADATFWLRAYSAGRLSQKKLEALIEIADIIILPITEGGGSNLKTAEAILADKKVVCTDHAVRSFEWFKEFPNVWMANTKSDFQAAILSALGAQKVKRSPEQQEKAESVDWEHTLKRTMKAVEKL